MIDQIRKPVEKEFRLYEAAFDEAVKTDNVLLGNILKYIKSTKGKELRPILVLLTASLFGKIGSDTIQSAVSLELLHTASLMHDDVVDETYQRRSKYSVNALWNNKISILVGDYYLSKSAHISAQMKNRRVTPLLAQLGCDLADGELLQLTNENKLQIDEPVYLDVIKKKTAKTFAFCTQAGAISADANELEEEQLRLFGEYLGMVFQMKDDIFDYFDSGDIGKPTGNDLKEGKMTLPLIFALKNAVKNDAKPILNMIRNKDYSVENLKNMSQFVLDRGGIQYAEKRMQDYKQLAIQSLSGFQDSSGKKALLNCLDFAMMRSK
ncbi:MAG: polyprenyl synthetase family protein [Bacteroidales bacterium]|nr:polyprenyl synthetase family protein [Bacteroidales bacterium]